MKPTDLIKKKNQELEGEITYLKSIYSDLIKKKSEQDEKFKDLETMLNVANETISNLQQKQKVHDNVKLVKEKPKDEIPKSKYSKTFYAQPPGNKYFTKVSEKYSKSSSMFELLVDETESDGEFFLYKSEMNYEDALLNYDTLLIFACEIPDNGIDTKTYKKIETPEDGKGKIKKVGDKWEIIKKAKIKLS